MKRKNESSANFDNDLKVGDTLLQVKDLTIHYVTKDMGTCRAETLYSRELICLPSIKKKDAESARSGDIHDLSGSHDSVKSGGYRGGSDYRGGDAA